MSDELLAYYEQELAYFREVAPEFARRHHRIAGRLRMSEADIDDPHVERLIQAVAFLNARTRRKIDDDFSEISQALLEVPTVGEFVPGYEVSTWYGAGAPIHTPAQVIDKINMEINAGLADPKIKARLADLGGTPLVGSPADFGKLIAEETEKWAKVVNFANIKPE